MTKKLTVIDNNSNEIDMTSPRTALCKVEHIREELARVYRATRTGKIPTAEATRLTYILISLSRIIETSDLESRVKKLEERG